MLWYILGFVAVLCGVAYFFPRTRPYFLRVGIAFDQFLNTLFGGHCDETFSASLYRKRNQKKIWKILYWIVNALFFLKMEDHCKAAFMSEMNRDDLPEIYRSAEAKDV